jgi:hypothetical protein
MSSRADSYWTSVAARACKNILIVVYKEAMQLTWRRTGYTYAYTACPSGSRVYGYLVRKDLHDIVR